MQSRHDVKWNVNFVWATHCYAQKKKNRRGWPRCRIYIYNYSHDTIISHHNSSARDVSSDRGGASHAAYQTAAWQAWHSAPGLVICTTQSLTRSASAHLRSWVSVSVCVSLPPVSSPLVFPRLGGTQNACPAGVSSSLSLAFVGVQKQTWRDGLAGETWCNMRRVSRCDWVMFSGVAPWR